MPSLRSLLAQLIKHALLVGAKAASISPVMWALFGTTIALAGCRPGELGPLSDLLQLILSNAPGVFAAVGIAIRAQKRIRISDDERERIAAEAQAAAVLSMAATIEGLRKDSDQAQSAVKEALTRERTATDLVKKLSARLDSMQEEHEELRRILRAGGIRVPG